MKARQSDEGAALLTVLMLVALMAALIAIAFDRTGSALNRTRSRISAHEARFNLMSAEAIALARLAKALGPDASISLTAETLGREITLPVPGGRISGRMRDGGNCFNLNALVTQSPAGILAANPLATDQLAKLLELRGIESNRAVPMAQAAADWIDSDALPLPAGSEGSAAANRMLDDPRELLTVPGWNAEAVGRVLPLLCALPVAQLPTYNINTLTRDQGALIAAVLPRGTRIDAVQAALASRPARGFDNAASLLNQPSLRGASPSGEAGVQFVTRADWFLLDLDAALGDSGLSERVLIDARFRPVRMVRRIYGEP